MAHVNAPLLADESLYCAECGAVVQCYARSMDFLCVQGHRLEAPEEIEIVVVRHRSTDGICEDCTEAARVARCPKHA